MLESEKESNVSESDVLDSVGEGGEERWRAIFSAGLVEGFPPLRFLPMVGVGEMLWLCEGAAPR